MRNFVFLNLLLILLAPFAFGQIDKNYDAPLRIIHKPKANYPPQEKGKSCVQGTVTLRVEFLETGEIGKISVVGGLDEDFNKCAIEAAKKIKFNPAIKDGKPVTVTKQVQYSFTLY